MSCFLIEFIDGPAMNLDVVGIIILYGGSFERHEYDRWIGVSEAELIN